MAGNRQRITVLYGGHVQGVGFRYTTHSIARHHAVTGYVRNLPDGRVELVAEGEQQALQEFLGDVQEHFRSQIRDEKRDVLAAVTGEFKGFEIRH